MGYQDEPGLSAEQKLIIPHAGGLLASATAWGAANRAIFDRFYVAKPTTVRYVNWRVDTASGNVQVGIVRLSGTGMADFTKVVDSGVISCPAAGDLRTDIGATLLQPGEHALFVWVDNTTMQGRWSSSVGATALRSCGLLAGASGGVPSTGTLTWSNTYVTASLEGNV